MYFGFETIDGMCYPFAAGTLCIGTLVMMLDVSKNYTNDKKKYCRCGDLEDKHRGVKLYGI